MAVVNAIIDGKYIQRNYAIVNKLKEAFLKKMKIGVKKQQFYDALKYGKPEPPPTTVTAQEILQQIRDRQFK